MKALALDLGASGGKVLSGSFDGETVQVQEIYRFKNEPVQHDGHLFWDIPAIHRNLLDAMRKAAPEEFSSFGADSFGNDYGLLDASGNLIAPVYTYRDCRTEGVLEWMDGVMPAREIYARTGSQRARFNTLVQLAAQSQAGDHALLDDAETLLFVTDLLDYTLCGERAAEYTIASVSQLYNRLEDRWDTDIIRRFGLPEKLFPKVLPCASLLGEAAPDVLHQTGAGRFTICKVAHHDTASAVAAVPGLEPHFAYISSGTWSLMGTETAEMITTDAAFQHNFANEGGANGSNRFLRNIMGLWLLQECRREFAAKGIANTFEEMEAKADAAAPFRSIINPDDPLFFEPGDMIGKIQSRCRDWGQPVPETEGEITRCIQESLALAYRATLDELRRANRLPYPLRSYRRRRGQERAPEPVCRIGHAATRLRRTL